MTATVRNLAAGQGWRVDDVLCTSGPHDPPFEEIHDTVCIALVTGGTFQYRSEQGSAVLAPGAVMLGNQGSCFECAHDHGAGDRCLSFHFTPDCLESIASAVPGVRRAWFAIPRLPPMPATLGTAAAAEAARGSGSADAFEELALQLAADVLGALADAPAAPSVSARDERRISQAVRRIEDVAEEPLGLAALAEGAAMSRYHFLRSFRAVVGTTPHQYVLHTRMRRAAARLRASSEPVSAIAWDAGFGDLSTFNRRFRRVVGAAPRAYRAAGRTLS